ncbi:MAG: biopolymer transporter ExbD [Phycisphaerales bacterium]|nr:biopolymer transporter ExbD [Phycisphaerales bacterium]
MRSRSIISNEGAGARINVTPMIDIVMVLIVFYLLVGQLAIDRKASIDLPLSSTGINQSQELDPIIVGITADGTLSINGNKISSERFAGEISGMHTRDPDTPIRVRAHRDAPFGVVRPVMHKLRDAGVPRVELMTEKRP